MGVASIRRLGPLWRKSSTSLWGAKKRCTTEDTEAREIMPLLFSANSVASVVSLLLCCGRLERHGEHRESRVGCAFAPLSNNFNIHVFDRGKREGTVGRSKEAEVECYPSILVNTHLLIRPVSVLTFSHPDCTVGPGVSPDPGACRPSSLCPLIAPATYAILLLCRFAFPDSHAQDRALRTTPRGLYRRLGIGKARIQVLPSPCPEGRGLTHQILALLRLVSQETQCPLVKIFDRASYALIIIARFISDSSAIRRTEWLIHPAGIPVAAVSRGPQARCWAMPRPTSSTALG